MCVCIYATIEKAYNDRLSSVPGSGHLLVEHYFYFIIFKQLSKGVGSYLLKLVFEVSAILFALSITHLILF